MATAIIKKVFEDFDIRFDPINTISKLDKFGLKMFNDLLYDWKVIGLLIASFLFSLPDYYFLTIVRKIINIALLKTKFELILNNHDFNQLDDIM